MEDFRDIDVLSKEEIRRVIVGERLFTSIKPYGHNTENLYCDYIPFHVKNGCTYVSLCTRGKFDCIENKKPYHFVFMLRRVKNKKTKKIDWKIINKTKKTSLFSAREKTREWKCKKMGEEFVPIEKVRKPLSEERRAELADRMLDFAGRKHNLPVFEKNLTCSACLHSWTEVTYDSGAISCPKCSHLQIY